MEALFEKASRDKSRFATNRGEVTVEDLWDLTLPQLNQLAKSLNKRLKEIEEEDFLAVSKSDTKLKNEFDIVLHVLNTKKAELDEKENAQKKKAEKQKLLEVLASKQEDALTRLSEEELKARIEALG